MTEYTARIENWVHTSRNTIVGEFHEDKLNRCEDGDMGRTSTLLSMSMQVSSPREGVVVFTQNNSYLLGKPYITE